MGIERLGQGPSYQEQHGIQMPDAKPSANEFRNTTLRASHSRSRFMTFLPGSLFQVHFDLSQGNHSLKD